MSDIGSTALHHDSGGSLAPTPEPGEGVRSRGPLGFMFWIAVIFLVVLTLSAIFAEVLPLKGPAETFKGRNREGPSLDHWFGVDGGGRDIFSRVIYGGQVSLIIASVGATLALLIGGMVGMAAGYYRRRVDTVITSFTDGTLVIPPLILALSLILFLDPTAERRVSILIFVFVLLSIAPIARVVRASTLVWSEREFVLAARTIGARNGRVMFREVLPNVAPALVSYSLIIMANLIVVEGAVAFLGLSVPPPTPTWGDMINKGRGDLDVAAHISLIPAMTMFLTVLALNFVGDKLQERYEPRESVL
ncbi:MAG: ABC transporter permease [Actinomycetia bacterium]|nr:ABC transporter permease [Actinomycetes bacterium]MCP4228446.1 ABC transporter permease [Actinomycetes bacterium]MCP5031645.1 ABC transporter permease [Actinomycetes bacterium]